MGFFERGYYQPGDEGQLQQLGIKIRKEEDAAQAKANKEYRAEMMRQQLEEIGELD